MTASRFACLLILCLLSGVGAGCDSSPRPRPWPVRWAHPALAAVVADYVRALPVDPFTEVVCVTRTAECAPAAVVQVEASIHHPYSAFTSGPRPVGYAVQDGTLLVFYDERPGALPVDVEAALTALIQQRHLRLQRGLERLYCPPIWFLVTCGPRQFVYKHGEYGPALCQACAQ
jgi:hypothetical protein